MDNEVKRKRAEDQAVILRELQQLVLQLDEEFLEQALDEMVENHNRRDSMAVLNPRPFMHNATQELDSAKIEQLKLYVRLAKNTKVLMGAELAVATAREYNGQLENLFGIR